MKPMREKIQSKLNNMASILLDDIIVPGEVEQEGQGTISAGYYDDVGNRFVFTLSLNVIPSTDNSIQDEVGGYMSLEEQMNLISAKLAIIEKNVSTLQSYHSEPSSGNDEPSSGDDNT